MIIGFILFIVLICMNVIGEGESGYDDNFIEVK
jgi:hypothetical protein